MEFNAKFFLATLFLSIVAGILSDLINWLSYFRLMPDLLTPLFSLIIFSVRIAQFFIGVFLTFGILYVLTLRENPAQKLKPIIVSTFLGCWIGSEIIVVTDIIIHLTRTDITYGLYFLEGIFYPLWYIFTAAFSPVLFVSLTAILLAHHQKQTTPTPHTY